MLAGGTRPLEDVILDQVTYLDSLNGGPTPAQTAALNELKAQVARVNDPNLSPSTPASELPLSIPAAYWLDLRGYQPASVAAGLRMRLLVLQGPGTIRQPPPISPAGRRPCPAIRTPS